MRLNLALQSLLIPAALIYAATLIYRLSPWQEPGLSWLLMLVGATLVWLLGAGLALTLVALWRRRWGWVALLIPILTLETGAALWRSQGPYVNTSHFGSAPFSVAIFNMQARPDALADFADLAQDVDVIYLAEVPHRHQELIDFAALFPAHRLFQAAYGSDREKSVMAILLRGQGDVTLGDADAGNDRPIFDVRLHRQGQAIRVLATHALIPASPAHLRHRDQTLARLRGMYDAAPHIPTLIMGDMNTTPFEAAGWHLPGRLIGNPFRLTWSGSDHTGVQRFAHLRIDHIRLAQNALTLHPIAQQVGPDLGSDHLPVFVWFDLP